MCVGVKMLRSMVMALGLATAAFAIPKLNIKGTKFFTDDGDQFFIKGIAYQRTPDDPLTDGDQCKLDADSMKNVGANAIRVYHVDPKGDHTGCMKTFADNGIYLFVDLDTFTTQIEQAAPHWNKTQLDRFTAVLDEFAKFDNTAGVFVGNEVITTEDGSNAAPFVKAATRDVKSYRDKKGLRKVPIGYSAADIAQLRPMLQNYLVCGKDVDETIDFFGLNAYEWCGQSTFQESGYQALTKNATDYNIPIFFSETGCHTAPPRDFQDQEAIFGDQMNSVWSGAIIYEWVQEANMYGLVNYGDKTDASSDPDSPDGYPRSGTPTPISPDYSNLKSQWAKATPTGVKSAAYNANKQAPACPTSMPGVWNVDGSVALPSLGQSAKPGGTSTSGGSGSSGSSGSMPTSGAASSSTPTGSAGAASPSAKKTGDAATVISQAPSSLALVLAISMVVFAF